MVNLPSISLFLPQFYQQFHFYLLCKFMKLWLQHYPASLPIPFSPPEVLCSFYSSSLLPALLSFYLQVSDQILYLFSMFHLPVEHFQLEFKNFKFCTFRLLLSQLIQLNFFVEFFFSFGLKFV